MSHRNRTDVQKRTVRPPRKQIREPPRDYQPSKAEMEEEYDMPGADMSTLRQVFFESVEIVKKALKLRPS